MEKFTEHCFAAVRSCSCTAWVYRLSLRSWSWFSLWYLHLIHTNQTFRIQTVFLFLHLYDVRHTALITSTQVNCESHKARVKEWKYGSPDWLSCLPSSLLDIWNQSGENLFSSVTVCVFVNIKILMIALFWLMWSIRTQDNEHMGKERMRTRQ